MCELGQIGNFDLMVASYLLNRAQTKKQLLQICQTIYLNLKPKGRFVRINDNVKQSSEFYSICAKYGLTKSISKSLAEGVPITLTFSVDGQKFGQKFWQDFLDYQPLAIKEINYEYAQ